MPSASSKRTSNSSRPSQSPTLTTSSYGYQGQVYQMPTQTVPQGQTNTSYNPAAIHSWVQGVQSNGGSARQQINMSDPAVQAYMQAKMGLYQQASAQKASKKSK
ncbi:hypothetical protein C1H76_0894 [Elsinoe australis]|uniref:Uncharacterized protein n=1 Tax=Elsinoe australis TaxID=40998 RepID=A0A4U7BAJ6_9PEZI|nr:hypothetical protein C1H76_0894 [Elsinoe australis]